MHGQVDPVSIVVGGTASVTGKHTKSSVYQRNVWLRAGYGGVQMARAVYPNVRSTLKKNWSAFGRG
jgi:hypothetical protein